MKRINTILILMLMVTGGVFLAGCTSQEDTEEVPDVSTLNIGYQPSTHQLAYMTAKEKGWWEEDLAPYGVENVREYEFPTGAPEMQSMLAGDLDVAYVGAAPFVATLASDLDAKIVAAANSQGSDLVLRPDITYEGPDDLKGLDIATFPPGTIQDTILRNWLKDNGIDPDNDVDIKAMGPGDAISAISAGQVDAVFLPHPAPTLIAEEGNGRSVVYSGEMLPDHVCCVVVVSGDLIRNHPDLVTEIVKTHIKGTEYSNENQDEVAQLYADRQGWDVDVIRASLEDWDGQLIADPTIIAESTVDYAQIQYELGYVNEEFTRADMFDMSFYEQATAE
ncbi:MAG: NitT/TauT family transport system substrate-binding protein [Methanohalophilus sp. T328-1]|jgi:NitT/TauT family transport system substrate-binding protein|uniref:NitT/TauT family transport system substrate-binding protein n=1 Tax=Methanohalophilus euhalobius TaxID=51203 RepID=A0A285G8F3_9EURY|nr:MULTISPECIES: ABC transporter substrate-binding protein [Methanohalophilus]KXS39152.1 MAG: NitT/TauT family transport system substrate-binding protein [Methanohalophilus sp. T328-1]ODV50431.1 MAG: NitT/TauT family transport system substrate-binding protein [Methanohalophilus sp. 2-GBenrich]TCL11830.1 NitT/TauT family transport system substrate-binding protein [Methanohalophilus euhalobius]SNY19837.1 NitT/TauT family transport system substrate-binding protein [Methanohalophilus euhalobius]